MAPYFLKQQDTLHRRVRKQEAKNQELAQAVLVGRRQVEELQQQVQALQQAWQASVRLCLFSLVSAPWVGGFLCPSLRDPTGNGLYPQQCSRSAALLGPVSSAP